jgi:hypothetical protein
MDYVHCWNFKGLFNRFPIADELHAQKAATAATDHATIFDDPCESLRAL